MATTSTGSYSAFTFCDRITDFVPAKRARALFVIPAHLPDFSSCLVSEATGQLAAWVSMAHIGFRGRPMAALAREARFLGKVAPGDTLELEVAIESCDEETVAYQGHACVAGHRVGELIDCVAPMLPQDDWDSAEDLAREFALLCGPGGQPGRFPGVPPLRLTWLERVPGVSCQGRLDVPAVAPYYADHFPRRPVFPASLMLDSALRVAVDLVSGAAGSAALQPCSVTRVKIRDWTLPGQTVDIGAEILAADLHCACVDLAMRVGERTVATARAEFAPRTEN